MLQKGLNLNLSEELLFKLHFDDLPLVQFFEDNHKPCHFLCRHKHVSEGSFPNLIQQFKIGELEVFGLIFG